MHVHLQIFGPLLPIVVVDDLDGAIQFINARSVAMTRANCLACYYMYNFCTIFMNVGEIIDIQCN